MSWKDRAKPAREVGDRPDLEDVLEHYGVELKYRTRATVRCPLHEDATPSCSINLDKQLWHCHSCGNGGDAWELIKKMEDTDFAGAKRAATALGLTAGDAGGGGQQLRGGSRVRRSSGSAPRRQGAGARDGGYVPSWRRK